MFIYFGQFNRKNKNSCLWYRWDNYYVYSECGVKHIYTRNEKNLNYCPNCGKIIEWVSCSDRVSNLNKGE